MLVFLSIGYGETSADHQCHCEPRFAGRGNLLRMQVKSSANLSPLPFFQKGDFPLFFIIDVTDVTDVTFLSLCGLLKSKRQAEGIISIIIL